MPTVIQPHFDSFFSPVLFSLVPPFCLLISPPRKLPAPKFQSQTLLLGGNSNQDIFHYWRLRTSVLSCFISPERFTPVTPRPHQQTATHTRKKPSTWPSLGDEPTTNLREKEVAGWLLPLQGPVIVFPFLPLTFIPRGEGGKDMDLNSQLS